MQKNQTVNKTQMKIYAIGAIVLITIVGGVIYFNDQDVESNTDIVTTTVPVIVTPSIQPIEEPIITPKESITDKVPAIIPESVTETQSSSITALQQSVEEVLPITVAEPKKDPLPVLDDSDDIFMAKASQLSWLPAFAKQLIKKDLARNFVTFVDNLSRGDLALKYSPIKKPETKFSINEIDNDMYIDPLSYKRYDAYVDMINSINVDTAITHLNGLTPLLDEAYMELGYEQGTFFITLEQAIEEMLQTPVIRNPIKVIAPSAMYKYADPQLEGLSEAQKLMLRMGPDNITKLRPKLQQIQVSLSELSE